MEERIIKLISEELRGSLTEESSLALQSWRNQAVENEKAYQDLVNIWHIRYVVSEVAPHTAVSFESWKAKNNIDTTRVKKLPAKNRLNIWLSRVAAIMFLGFMLWYLYPTTQDDNFWNAEGDNVTVNMTDGSVITLRKNTLMRDIAGENKDTERRVALSGEAFFKVAPDQSRPFYIEIEDVTIEVVGTEFNVSLLPETAMVEVAVLSGTVRIHVTDGGHTLNGGECFRWDTQQKKVHLSDAEIHNAWSWHTGQLQFKSTPLLQVVEALNRHFDTQISLENSTLAHCRFTSNFHSATLQEVIEVLSATFGLNAISNKEGVYHLVGGHCDG